MTGPGHKGRVAAAPGAPAQKKFARARKPQVQAAMNGVLLFGWSVAVMFEVLSLALERK
jgi:hypothetical protein